jgi:hypothetical protein
MKIADPWTFLREPARDIRNRNAPRAFSRAHAPYWRAGTRATMDPQASPHASHADIWKRLSETRYRYTAWLPEPMRDAMGILAGLAVTAAAVDLVLMLLSFHP